MDDLRLVVGLIRIDRQQIQISGKDLLRSFPVRAEDALKRAFRFPIGITDLYGHFQRYGDLLIAWQFLAHIRQG